jgi:hypothetical protein
MNLKSRLRKLEIVQRERWQQYLETLSDDELEKLAKEYEENFPLGSEWLKTLTDGELDILIEGRTGARAIEQKYYEFKRQNQTAGSIKRRGRLCLS